MAYKLYDFQDPEIDEQIRLITDVLYNHREIYPGQLATPQDPFWCKQNLYWCSVNGNTPAHILVSSTGVTLTQAGPGTETDLATADEPCASAASATSGSRAGWADEASTAFLGSTASGNAFDFGFYCFFRVTLDNIADLRFRIVMGNSGNPANNDNPWGAANTQDGGLAFNFLPATSPNWFAVGKLFGTTSLAFNQDLTVPVVANTIYNLEIVVKGQGASRTASFWINGIKYYTETGNTYSSRTGQSNLWSIDLYPTVNTLKQVGVFRGVWGSRPTTTTIPDPHGYRNWVGQE